MIKKGSMTIEATFIIPLCFFIMVAFLYMAMYLHDCYTLETVIRTTVQREIRYVLQEESVEDGKLDWQYWSQKTIIWALTANLEKEKLDLKQYIEKSLEGKLLLAQCPSIFIEMDHNKVTVSYESAVQWNMNFLTKWMESKDRITGILYLEGIEPQEWIRMCKGILGRKEEL